MLVLALCLVIFSYSKFYSVTTMLSELDLPNFDSVITFCVSRRRRKMYCGHARLSVCVSVRGHMPTLLHGPGCNLGRGSGCPLVVHYWTDLQTVHGLRCYGNITRTLVTSLRPSRDMMTYYERSVGCACTAGG